MAPAGPLSGSVGVSAEPDTTGLNLQGGQPALHVKQPRWCATLTVTLPKPPSPFNGGGERVAQRNGAGVGRSVRAVRKHDASQRSGPPQRQITAGV